MIRIMKYGEEPNSAIFRRSTAAADVSGLDLGDIKPVNDRADHAGGMIMRQVIAHTRRKKQIIVGIVRFIDYLCHC